MNGLSSFNAVVNRTKEKRNKSNSTKKAIDPFRTTAGGKFFFFDKTAGNPSDPTSMRDNGAMPYVEPKFDTLSNIRTEKSKTLTKQSQRTKSVAQLSNHSIASKTKGDFVNSLIKRTNATDVNDMLKKVKEHLKD